MKQSWKWDGSIWTKNGLKMDWTWIEMGVIVRYMELRIKVDDAFIKDLTSKLEDKQLGEVTGSRMAQDALALFKWAVEETSKGRVVGSSDPDGNDVQRVVMPALNITGSKP